MNEHNVTENDSGLVAGEDIHPGDLVVIGEDGRVYPVRSEPLTIDELLEQVRMQRVYLDIDGNVHRYDLPAAGGDE